MQEIEYIIKYLYGYRTDFIINLANILGISYYEVNFMLFCVAYPLLFVGLLSFYAIQRIRLNKLKSS